MNAELWKLIASIGGLLITVVTAPFLWAIRAESKLIRAEMKLGLSELKTELKTEMGALKTEMGAMESRLNERIDTRLVHR